jgi:uncharacterized membrane protein YjjB (DUF3815 family)
MGNYILALVFFAQFASVFALVMNSKLLRDDRWVLAMLNSLLISLTQFIFVYVVSSTGDIYGTFFAAAAGGSLGCGTSHLFYTRFIFKKR